MKTIEEKKLIEQLKRNLLGINTEISRQKSIKKGTQVRKVDRKEE